MRFFIELQYDGTKYSGWQVQPNAKTVQGVLEKALYFIMSKYIKIIGASRTDSGVHAKQTFAHFDYEENFDFEYLKSRLNSFLPDDINVINIYKVKPHVNARFDAEYRIYEYYISYKKNPFDRYYSFFINKHIDQNKINDAANLILEYDNFEALSKKPSYDCSNICHIKESYFQERNDKIIYVIKSNRFLRNMVRSIVANILMIGTGKTSIDMFRELIESRDRTKSNFSVPANGLFLKKVHYPINIFE